MAKELSRRNFLKGAAAGATGLGITGILNQYAGIATPVVKAEESSEETQINWTDAADMIVVGGGGTGFTAAIEAARAGSSVIILEKSDICGGDTVRSGGMIMVAGSDLQRELGYEDSIENFVNTELRYCGEYADAGMVREMCEASLDELQFMMDLGREYDIVSAMLPVWGYDNEDEWAPRTHFNTQASSGHFKALETEVNSLELISVKTGKEAVHLVQNSKGEVIGVEVADGTFYRANKGVLLATASFGKNKEMSRRYNLMNYWALNYEDYYGGLSVNPQCSTNTGDGIRMAQEVGADLALTSSNCISDCCALSFDSLYGAILVNPKGVRFVQENAHWGYLNQMAFNEAIRLNAANPENLFWIIADDTAVQNNYYFNTIVNGIELTGSAEYIAMVVIKDTLEELAEATGLPEETLLNTVSHWNEMVDAGEDIDFQRKNINGTQDLERLETGPFYAFPYIPYSMGSFGGLRTNSDTQVLNTAGEVIPRLYAAGAIMSGMYTAPFYNACGWSILGTVHWGRKAGTNIAALTAWTDEEVIASESDDEEAAVQAAIENADGNYTAGTYQASAEGRNGSVTVEVEFSDTAITSVQIIKHTETEGIGTAAIDQLPNRILLAQSADVDTVTSATITSEAILTAVKDCISQASK